MTDTIVQDRTVKGLLQFTIPTGETPVTQVSDCLLYTSDAADEN